MTGATPTATVQPYTIDEILKASKAIVKLASEGKGSDAEKETYTAFARAIGKSNKDLVPDLVGIEDLKKTYRPAKEIAESVRVEAISVSRYTLSNQDFARRLFRITKGRGLEDELESRLIRAFYEED